MIRVRACVAVCLLAVSALVGVPPAIAGSGAPVRTEDFLGRVDRAIDRGAAWLLAQQLKEGGFGTFARYPAAQTALAYHTLRVCGVPRTDPALERAYRVLRDEYLQARDADQLRTYTAALVMMAIESHGWADAATSARESRYATQRERITKLDEPDLAWMRELTAFVVGNQAENGGWRYGQRVDRYTKGGNSQDYDHSNTQYALLGLKSARRCGVDVDAAVFRRTLDHLLDAQESDGPDVPRVHFGAKGSTHAAETDRARGWSYVAIPAGRATRDTRNGSGAYGSMTAGSLGAVVICRSELLDGSTLPRKVEAASERSVWDGVAWLGRHFTVTANPSHPGWHYYYLYALERAGVLAGVDWMGDHDWYGEGADFLVREQADDGRWRDAGPDLVTTCFALLFLKRGTLPVARGAVTPSGAADAIDFAAAARLRDKDLEDFVDLVVSRWPRAQTAAAREELRRGLASVGRKIVPPLLRRMATGDDAERASAHALAAGVTGQSFAYDPAADAATRFDALVAWEEWYMARASRLRFDSATGTLVAD